MKLLLEMYAEQKVILNKLLRQQTDSMDLLKKFPIPTEEQLIVINTEITEDNKHAYVSINYINI